MKKAKIEGGQVVDWLAKSGEGFKLLTENLPGNCLVKDSSSVYLYVNSNWLKTWDKKLKEVVGKTDFDFFPKEVAEILIVEDRTVMQTGQPLKTEMAHVFEGQEIIKEKYKIPIKNDEGETFGILGFSLDITRVKQSEEVVARQSQEIMELSTPVMQVWEGVVVAPLIGMLDSERTQQFMERFLNGITKTQSPVALLDITGVPAVDTQTAQHLVEAITAAKLLGTRVILTGVRPAIAQTMVHLGIDLAGVDTKSSLSAGLRLCFEILGMHVSKNEI